MFPNISPNISCDLNDNYTEFVDQWKQNHDKTNGSEGMCLFQLPKEDRLEQGRYPRLEFSCGDKDDGFRILGCKSIYTFIQVHFFQKNIKITYLFELFRFLAREANALKVLLLFS